MLQNIIPSKARRKILQLFFNDPAQSHYLRQIVRDVDEEVNAVKRELDILSEAKLLTKEKRLNKVFYTLNKNYMYYDDFLKIFAKSLPLAEQIYKNEPKLGKIKFAVLSLKFVKKVPIKEDEIYLLFVGTVVVPEISTIIAPIEKTFGQEIHYTVMSEEELSFRKRNNDPFIWRFLRYPKVMLVGHEEELMK